MKLMAAGAISSWLKKKWPWLLVFALLGAVHLTNVSSEFGGNVGGDSVIYYLLGKALATGQGYVDLYLPGHPPHVKYPFLFPLLLAPFHLAFKNPLPAMHAMVALFNVAAAVALGLWAGRRWGSERMGLCLALVFGTLPRLYLQSGHLLTEPLYMAFCFLALLLLPADKGAAMIPGRFALLGLLVLAAFFTRTAGVALALAVGLDLLLRRTTIAAGKRQLPAGVVLLVIFALAAGLWVLRNKLAGAEGLVYLRHFMVRGNALLGSVGFNELAFQTYNNFKYYFYFLGLHSFTPGWTVPLPYLAFQVIGYGLFAVIVTGLVLELWRGRYGAELFLVLSMVMVILWPFMEDRFLLPVLPLASFYLLRAIKRGLGFIPRPKAASWAMAGIMALVLVCQGYLVTRFAADRLADGRDPKVPVRVEGYGTWERPVINWAKYDLRFIGVDREDRKSVV